MHDDRLRLILVDLHFVQWAPPPWQQPARCWIDSTAIQDGEAKLRIVATVQLVFDRRQVERPGPTARCAVRIRGPGH